MKKVGLTGGIGSGKTTVAKMFASLGVPIYNSDQEAKNLMTVDPELRKSMIDLFGPEAYQGESLNREFIAARVFHNRDLLQQLNAVVHPAVRNHFREWMKEQEAHYVIQEAAILFENGSYKDYDFMILVTAPTELRISRIQERDGTTVEQIRARMEHQWEESKKIPLAHFVIKNHDLETTRTQVEMVHEKILASP